MTWRYEPDAKIKDYHLVNVSVYMLQRKPPPEGLAYNMDITDDLFSQGWSDTNNSLVKSAWDIYTAAKIHKASHYAEYNCQHTGKRPEECLQNGAQRLRFRFLYSPVQDSSPYGEIGYNFAEICPTSAADGGNATCLPSKGGLGGGWRLFYFETHHWFSRRKPRINVSQPFRKAYTSPMPKYTSTIQLCTVGEVFDCSQADGDDDGKDCDDEDDVRRPRSPKIVHN